MVEMQSAGRNAKNARLRALHCETCGTSYPPNGSVQSYCPRCGPFFGTLECRIDIDNAGRELSRLSLNDRTSDSILRYAPLLPFQTEDVFPELAVGMTPLIHSNRLANRIGISKLYIKDDGLNPSGSYKDRASAVVAARSLELGFKVVCCASTGNAAASLAVCGAAMNIPIVVFVPEDAPRAKLAQIAAYGAHLIAVDGTYDEAFDLATEACVRFGWFNRSAGLNPYLVEGKKTGAYELCEQLAFKPPDVVFVGVGDGSVITGIVKGFKEFKTLGYIDKVPRVYGVQATGAKVLAEAFQHYKATGNIEILPGPAQTCADSISVGYPREGVRAIRAVDSTGGRILSVDDSTILEAVRLLPREAAVFAEPAGAVGLAGLIHCLETGDVHRDETAGIFVTGSGLKDIATVSKAVLKDLPVIKPDVRELSRLALPIPEERS